MPLLRTSCSLVSPHNIAPHKDGRPAFFFSFNETVTDRGGPNFLYLSKIGSTRIGPNGRPRCLGMQGRAMRRNMLSIMMEWEGWRQWDGNNKSSTACPYPT
jgi:hypothetical protein